MNNLIDPSTGEGWDQHVYWDNENELTVENIPSAVRKLMGARSRLIRMENLNAPEFLLENQRYLIHQALDQVEMWIDWLREELPPGTRYDGDA